jgi:hypothetical protein
MFIIENFQKLFDIYIFYLNVGFQEFTDNEECRQLPESAKMSRPQTRQAGAVHHPNSNINLDEVGEGESLESKMVLPDDFDDVIKDMVSYHYCVGDKN